MCTITKSIYYRCRPTGTQDEVEQTAKLASNLPPTCGRNTLEREKRADRDNAEDMWRTGSTTAKIKGRTRTTTKLKKTTMLNSNTAANTKMSGKWPACS